MIHMDENEALKKELKT